MRAKATLLVLLVMTVSLAGCFGATEAPKEAEIELETDQRIFVNQRQWNGCQ